MKLLVVEDEVITREQLSLLAKSWGYEILQAANGIEALEIIDNTDVGIVVTDLVMPGIDGIELCRKIRSRRLNRYVYVLVITGKGDQNSMYDAMFSGADDFIIKPWNKAEVRARLRTGERILNLEAELQDQIKKLQEANQLIIDSNSRMQREMQLMGRIQSSLLPAKDININQIQVSWKHKPYCALAADGFNLFRLDENYIGFYMLDVAASGSASSYVLASLARKLSPIPGQPALLKRLTPKAPGYELSSPASVLNLLSKAFPFDLDSQQSFSIFYAMLDLTSGKLTYANAAQPSAFLSAASGSVVELEGAQAAISTTNEARYVEKEIIMHPGDRLFMVSDGISCVEDETQEPFGRKKLGERLKKTQSLALPQAVEGLYREGLEWSVELAFNDDASIFAIEYEE